MRDQLASDLEQVRVSTQSERAVSDFESSRPDVLVLAFDSVEKAQRYSPGLFRQSAFVNRHRHRTVLLCTKQESRLAFDLCKQGYFDDYVLQWPLAHDGLRLTMSVWNAAREILALDRLAGTFDLPAHARSLAAMEALLDKQLGEGDRRASTAKRSLEDAERAVDAALDALAQRLGPGSGGAPSPGLGGEIGRLKEPVTQALRSSVETLAPIAAWSRQLKDEVGVHLAALRETASRAAAAAMTILVVDDDEFARELIAKALQSQPYQLLFAATGAEALAALRNARPDLILMDINLPDMDGVTLTGRPKAVLHLAPIPVLMLTGEARRETLASSISAGAADFIVKPFSRDALLAKLAGVLERTA